MFAVLPDPRVETQSPVYLEAGPLGALKNGINALMKETQENSLAPSAV